jgi:Ca2+-binding EF-hand superfamily protein
MYEIMTAIDIMRYNSMKGVKISFIYRDEFQVMSENTGTSSERYFKRKDAHRKYLEIAEYFDEHLVPTFRKKTILVMRGPRGEEFTGYEKISSQDLNSYIFRITNRNYELRFLFEDLKIEDTVTFYHFFAVLESYRKRVFVDEYKVDIDPLKAVNVAPIERNAESIRLPVDTSVLKPGSYEHDLYNIKVTVKADYNNIYSLFKQAAPEGSFKYDAFKRHLKEKINPRISEANLNELIRRVDKDRNQEVSLEEFFSYIFETPFEQSIQKQDQKFDSSRKLEPKDYFDPGQKNYSTILNSEETAIIKCKELLKNIPQGKLFEDPDFGPHLGRNGDECLYWNKVPPSSSYPNPHSEEFEWRHASDVFMQPDFIKQGTESGDVIQGSLGDCWFIGALSVMALRDDLLYGNMEDVNDPSEITIQNAKFMNKGVYSGIFHNLKDVGMFVFKFFINSAWRWVIVDDRLPMFVDSASGNSEYVFGHCRDKSELWVALIEKAYAKVFGCYEALNGGLIDDALTDLTGLVAEKCKISGPGGLLNLNLPDAQATEALWARLEQYRKDRTLMGCSIEGEGTEGDVVFEGEMTGLLSRHAYSIIDVLNLQDPQAPKGRHRLLRIRNPWGQREWMGKWRDHSEELEKFREQINAKTAELGEEEKFKKFDPNDGTFFMCFKDWRRIFHNLYACVDFSKEWFGKRFAGQWNVSNSGGVPLSGKPDECIRWAKNPQFCLELKANAEVFISLSQKDGRYARNSKFPFDDIINTACFTIMRGEQSELLLNRFDQGKIEKLSVLKAHRNIEMRIFLKAGKYFIVPSTMNAGKTGEFWLSVYFNSGKQNVSIFDCRNSADVGMIIQEEEEDEENYTEKDLELIRNKFLSLRHKI